MCGNILSVALWVAAVDFRTFLASRVVGGLSEGNVQIATSIAADVSTPEQRGATMALVGACFSIAFTFGPALGAGLANITTFKRNPFATAAGFSLLLIVTETIYLWLALPETLPSDTPVAPAPISEKTKSRTGGTSTTIRGKGAKRNSVSFAAPATVAKRTNSHTTLNLVHFSFILFFSGMEFSLPFMTYDLFKYSSAQSGKLLGFIGLVASVMQGGVVRRVHPLRVVQMGVVACVGAFIILGRLETQGALYGAATLLAITSGSVVTGLNSLSSFEAGSGERGSRLGNHRSFGMWLFSGLTKNHVLTMICRTNRKSSRPYPLLYAVLVGRQRSRIQRWKCRYGRCSRTYLRRIESTSRHGDEEESQGLSLDEKWLLCLHLH